MGTIDTKLTKYRAELLRLETILEEQERYKSLKAQGLGGSESQFTDFSKIESRITKLENLISNLTLGSSI